MSSGIVGRRLRFFFLRDGALAGLACFDDAESLDRLARGAAFLVFVPRSERCKRPMNQPYERPRQRRAPTRVIIARILIV